VAITTATAYKILYPTALSDAIVTTLIASAQDAIERWCGRKFDQATYTQVTSGDLGPALLLPNRPITSVTSVTIIDDDGDTEVVDSSAYRFDPDTGVLSFIDARYGRLYLDEYGTRNPTTWGFVSAFPDRFRNVSTIYVGGYLAAAMPPSLVQLVNEMVGSMITDGVGTSGVNHNVQSETLGSYSYTLASTPAWVSFQKRAISLWGNLQ